MGKNYQNIKDLLQNIPDYPVPAGLQQRVLTAVHAEQKRSKKFSYRLWISGLLGSATAVLLGVAWSLQSLVNNEVLEIMETAIFNLRILGFSDVFWGIMENLPLNSLALTFCAITALGLLSSIRKNHRVNILFLQHT